jgi:HK97 family phage portal protein
MTILTAAESFALQREAAREQRMGRFVEQTRTAISEVRDPRGATNPVLYTSPGRAMIPEWNGDEAVRWAYSASVTVNACVGAYANAIAGAELRFGRDPKKPGENNPNHPLVAMLGLNGMPARQWAADEFWRWMVANRIVQGRWAAEKERAASGRTVALWPMVVAPSVFKAIPTAGGAAYWSGFQYGPPNKMVPYKPEDVAYGWRKSLLDIRQPESLLQAARIPISVDVMSGRYYYAFLRNDARPAAIIVHQMFDDLDERDAWRREFTARYQGPDNAGQIHFAEFDSDGTTPVGQSLDVKQLGMSQKDAQFAALHEAARKEIAVALGVPYSLLDASGRTYDNANVEERHFYENRVIPMGKEMANWVNSEIAPEFGSEVAWFSFDHVEAMRPASRFSSEAPSILISKKILKRSELRTDNGVDGEPEQDNLPGVGSTLLEQAQAAQALVTAGYDPAAVCSVVGLPAIAIKEEVDEAEGDAPPDAAPVTPPAKVLPLPKAADTALLTELRAEADAIEARRARIWRSVDAQVRGLQVTWERSFRALFAKQAKATLERLKGKPGRQMLKAWVEKRDDKTAVPQPDDVFTPGYWQDETAAVADPLLRSVFSAGSARLVDDVGLSFDITAPYVDEFIQQRANQLAGEVTDTTYQAIKDALSAGVEAGDSIDALSQRVQDVFDAADSERARTIARTEVNSAYHAAGQEVADQVGPDVVAGKEWIAVRDGRTRPEHADADGQVVDITAMFRVGGVEMRTPGTSGDPGEDCNCRCTVGWLTPAEMEAHRSGVVEFPEAMRRLQAVAEARAA